MPKTVECCKETGKTADQPLGGKPRVYQMCFFQLANNLVEEWVTSHSKNSNMVQSMRMKCTVALKAAGGLTEY